MQHFQGVANDYTSLEERITKDHGGVKGERKTQGVKGQQHGHKISRPLLALATCLRDKCELDKWFYVGYVPFAMKVYNLLWRIYSPQFGSLSLSHPR